MPSPLPTDFFARSTLTVARDLLGKLLIRQIDDITLSCMIVETEAYQGTYDTACHAAKGRTPRTETMFGPPGRAYIYLVYGMHSMLNVVTEPEGNPCAVLIRAAEPITGQATMAVHRRKNPAQLTNGPARLCQALAIDTSLNRCDVTVGGPLWIADYRSIPADQIAAGPRIGIGYAATVDQAAPWRLWIVDNGYVSR